MPDDSSDILGGHLQVAPTEYWYQLSLLGSFAVIVVLGVIVYSALIYFARCNEGRYRKKLRRRYGIPDTDTRPFNVAYASLAGKKIGSAQLKQAEGRPFNSQPSAPYMPHTDGTSLRQRPRYIPDNPNVSDNDSTYNVSDSSEDDVYHLPKEPYMLSVLRNQFREQRRSSHRAPRHRVREQHHPSHTASTSPTLSQSSRHNPPAPAFRSTGKHAREDDIDVNPEKKSRLADSGEADEGDVSGLHEDMDIDEGTVEHPKRGSKRSANPEDDENIESAREQRRDKRARKVSLEKVLEQPDEDMIDDSLLAEDFDEAERSTRGRKRDRAEAESTFGGDESFGDDDATEEAEKSRRRRKRRTVSQKKATANSRGQKRGRDIEAIESGEESERPKKRETRRRREKKGSEAGALLDTHVSNDPLCKGRRIGEEWEANGVCYKVGPNGQRLRQELVKKSRSRFPMPRDSQHPDRQVNVNVYVETWLSEEEYRVAKERQELAWQDYLNEPSTAGDVPDSPTHAGKSLLWSSTNIQNNSPVPQRGPFRQSVATHMGLRINPFTQSQALPGRRISSAVHVNIPPPPDSPKLRTSRSYSKWEKQDLEAAAMAKIREKAKMNAAQATEAPKIQSAPASQPVAQSASAPALSFTFSKPAEKPTQAGADKPLGPGLTVPAPSFGPAAASPQLQAAHAPQTVVTPEAPKPSAPPPSTFSFAAPPAGSATVNKPVASSTFFAPTTATATSSNQNQSGLATSGAQQRSNTTPTSSNPFNFAAPSASMGSTTGNVVSNNAFVNGGNAPMSSSTTAANAPPKFSFGAPPATTGVTAQQAEASQTSATGNSLLNRLGPAPTQAQSPSSSTATSQQSSTAPTFSFGFGKPANPTPAPAPASAGIPPTVAPPASSSTNNALSATTTAPSAAPKFNFGFSPKPGAPATQASPMSATTSTADNGDGSKSSSGFGMPASSTSTFAQPSFGSQTPMGQPLSFGGATSTTPGSTADKPHAAFGAQTGPAVPSAFSTATNSGTESVFGSAAQPADGSKSLFGFGNTGMSNPTSTSSVFGGGINTPSASTPTAQSNATNPSSAFAMPAPTSAPAPSTANTTSTNANDTQNKPVFSFNFGAPPSSSTATTSAFGAQSAASPFGKPPQPTPAAFGFSDTSTSTGTSTFGFPAANQNQKQ